MLRIPIARRPLWSHVVDEAACKFARELDADVCAFRCDSNLFWVNNVVEVSWSSNCCPLLFFCSL